MTGCSKLPELHGRDEMGITPSACLPWNKSAEILCDSFCCTEREIANKGDKIDGQAIRLWSVQTVCFAHFAFMLFEAPRVSLTSTDTTIDRQPSDQHKRSSHRKRDVANRALK